MSVPLIPSGGRKRSQDANMMARRFSQIIVDERRRSSLAHALAISGAIQQECEDQELIEREALAEESEASKAFTAALQTELKQLEKSWNDLRSKLSKDDQEQLKEKPLNFDTVQDAVNMWEDRDKKKEEKEYSSVKGHFSRFCKFMSAYSELLSFIPCDDKYLKVFCGVVTMIVKASVNHGKIAKGFASALADIGVEMTYWRDQLAAFQAPRSVASPDSLTLIVTRLYTKVFQFLIPYLVWSQSGWEKMKGSASNNYYERNIQGPLNDIFKLSDQLKRAASIQDTIVLLRVEDVGYKNLETGLRNVVIGGAILDSVEDFRALWKKREETHKSEIQSIKEALELLKEALHIGIPGMAMLEANSEAIAFHGEGDVEPQRLNKAQNGYQVAARTAGSVFEYNEYTFTQVEPNSRHLGVIETGFSLSNLQQPPNAAGEVLGPLQEWTTASESRTLWMYGPSTTATPSDLSRTASYVASTVNRLKIPLIAHSCQRLASRTDSLMLMAYSLVRQLIWLLPDKFKSNKDFGSSRFGLLNGHVDSVAKALVLIEDLLSMMPKLLICVIDGFQFLDDDEEDNDNSLFLNFLLEILKEAQTTKVLKILITTDGYSRRLWQTLRANERVDVMGSERRKTGRRPLMDLTFREDFNSGPEA